MTISLGEIRRNEIEPTLNNKVVLITGGTHGTGLTIASAAYARGAQLVLGTRRPDHFRDANKLFDNSAYGMIGDVGEPENLVKQVKDLRDEGVVVTDFIHSAASGLEPITWPLTKELIKWKTRPIPGGERLTRLQQIVHDNYDKALGKSKRVNLNGPKELLTGLSEILPEGFTFIFMSSLWSTFYGQVETAHFYVPIASVKHQFEQCLTQLNANIFPSIVSGSVLKDTDLAFMIKTLSDQVPGAVVKSYNQEFPSTVDMAEATIDLLMTKPENLGHLPAVRYVIGPNEIVSDFSPSDRLFSSFKINL
ncbi:hypothetical protein A2866_04695 [Candidatus Roizmanbacteria bacterium RIFCSPHIGHO2_01_FULL_39_8]|uniref:Ketoreductase (KR) domain-containing protein n=2 Tax=Candidatus Roizmaniibacteriota TaxID=1752723 RepID=A0A1F7GN37_9BACT|nr:MAG: hypothetical protein A2866_04695 [Candidatus Roizmanbacteria bacterium RIFCSPHIGHO2_01_FULL_39_8]OGK28041.1 MAG: hypothetical protein A3C28_02545 [Candidatus Roizmanbacteria bacterium RIFCSPHIGHO2_02_FULL_39_9]